jgi:signal peptidase
MKANNQKFSIANNFAIIVCAVLIITETALIAIALEAIRLYNMAFRPLVYVTLVVTIYVFMGFEERPIEKTYETSTIAIILVMLISGMLFGIVLLAASFMFGAGNNIATISPANVMYNLWSCGLIVILGEIIRYRLIKDINKQTCTGIIVISALTVAMAYSNTNVIHIFIHTDIAAWAIFFETVFAPLVISAVASYLAMKGSLLSAVLVSFVYTMAPHLIPILPDISAVAFNLMISALAFATVLMYHFAISEKGHHKGRYARLRIKRVAKYAKKSISSNLIVASIIGVVVIFFIGLLPVYPRAILTNSMTGTIERGSLVFVERMSPDEVIGQVNRGDIIHFVGSNGLEYIHRVVDFTYDSYDERKYITQGDASIYIDPFPIPQENVHGAVRGLLPFLGYPYIFFQAIIDTIIGHH